MKVVFIDFSGTLIRLGGPDIMRFRDRVLAHSDIKSGQELWQVWRALVKGFEATSVDQDFLIREEMVKSCLSVLEEDYHLKDDFYELTILVKNFWNSADIYPDAREFMLKCPYPIYVVSNVGAPYIAKCLERAGIRAQGIITGELVHAYKPNPRLLLMALELTGSKPEDVIHIGDEYNSDVLIPSKYGVKAYLVDRDDTSGAPQDCKVKDMRDLLKII